MACLILPSNSSNFSGRLSSALGRRKPCSTSVSLRAVAAVHGRHLRHALVGLVHDQDEVLGHVVDQARRRLARLAVGKMPRVVLDAVAEAHLLEHLQVVERALLEALALEQLALPLQLRQALAQLLPDRVHGPMALVLGGDVVGAGVDAVVVELAQDLATQGLDLANGLDLVAPVLDAHGPVFLVGGEDLDHVAADAEGAAMEVHVVALVLDVDQVPQQRVAAQLLAALQAHDHLLIPFGRADAVDAAHRGDDDHVLA
jgi:hypothetical protein